MPTKSELATDTLDQDPRRAVDIPPTPQPVPRALHALHFAVLAPSLHNSQPWNFRLGCDPLFIDLLVDVDRQVPVLDPRGRQMFISCGAALKNLTVGLRACGLGYTVDPPRLDDEPALVARVRIGDVGPMPEDDELLLAGAVAVRQTARGVFAPTEVPKSLLLQLLQDAVAEGVDARLVQRPGERAGVAFWTQLGHHREIADQALADEVAYWTRPADAHSHDGVVAESFGRSSHAAASGPFPVRDFAQGSPVADRPGARDPESMAILVLSTAHDNRADWLAAGRGLEAVLLRAAIHGVHASYLNQSVELVGLREQLRAELHLPGVPQLILRLGYPMVSGEPVSPRRPVGDVLLAPEIHVDR